MRVTVEVDENRDGDRIRWYTFVGYKGTAINEEKRLFETTPIVKNNDKNMKNLGREIFEPIRDILRY